MTKGINEFLKDFPVVLAGILSRCVLKRTRDTVRDTIRLTFAEVALPADHVDSIKVNITERTGEHTHFAAGTSFADYFDGTGHLVLEDRRCRADFKAPRVFAMQTGLRKADLDVIMVFDTDVGVFPFEIPGLTKCAGVFAISAHHAFIDIHRYKAHDSILSLFIRTLKNVVTLYYLTKA